jgi:putative flavoprotein involved in K+ transport
VHWLLETGLADDTVDSLPSPAARLACNPPVSGNDGGHDCNPRWLARRGATLLGRVEAVERTTISISSGIEQTLAQGDEFEAGFKQRVDDHISAVGLAVSDPEPSEPHAPVPPIEKLDLKKDGVSAILWANGFRPDHTWIEGLETDAQGWPVHERGVTALPGLYFVGLHWLHKRKSALIVGVGEDAEHVASHIAGSTRAGTTAERFPTEPGSVR